MTFDFGELAAPAWSQLWQVSVMILAVGLVTRLLCRRRPHLAYVLWLLVIVKCLTPPVWSSPTGVFSWTMARPATTAVVETQRTDAPIVNTVMETDLNDGLDAGHLAEATPALSSPLIKGATAGLSSSACGILPENTAGQASSGTLAQRLDLATTVGLLWLSGAAVHAGILIVMRLGWSWRLRRWRVPARPEWTAQLDKLSRQLGVRRKVRLLVTSQPVGPAVFGLLRPTLVMPEAILAEKNSSKLEVVLAHELLHVRRGDTVVGLLQLLAQTLWWFHPLVWWANREQGRQRERCCDEEVLASLDCEPADYAQSLIDLLKLKRSLRPIIAFPGIRPVEVTSKRLESIMDSTQQFRAHTPRWYWLALAVGILAFVPGAGLTLGDSVPPSDEKTETLDTGIGKRSSSSPAAEQDVEGTLSLEARVVGIDGKPVKKCFIKFWRAVDPDSTGNQTPRISTYIRSKAEIWRYPNSKRVWKPVGKWKTNDRATKEKLTPGDYCVIAWLGSSSIEPLCVSDIIHLDGSRQHSVARIQLGAGPALIVTVVDAETGNAVQYTPQLWLVRNDGLIVASWPQSMRGSRLKDGRLEFPRLAPATYTLHVRKRAYRHGHSEYAANPIKIELTAGHDKQITAVMRKVKFEQAEIERRWPWSVTGKVTGGQGQPIEGVKLRVLSGMGTLFQTGETVTDKQGKYTLRFTRSFSSSVLLAANILVSKPGFSSTSNNLLIGDKLPEKSDHSYALRDRVILPGKPRQWDFVMKHVSDPAQTPSKKVESADDKTGKPTAKAAWGKEIPPGVRKVMASLRAELVKLGPKYPQLTDIEALEVKQGLYVYGLKYLHDCKYLGKRGHEDTGPNPAHLRFQVYRLPKTGKNFPFATQMPSHRWSNLNLVGWTRVYDGNDVSEGFQAIMREVLSRHVAMIDELDRQAGAQTEKVETKQKVSRPDDQPSAGKPAVQRRAINKRVDMAAIIARHVLLLDGKEIITWDELEKRIAALPDPSRAYPHFYTTRGAHEAGIYPKAKEKIWRLHKKFKLKGHSEGSLGARADSRFDRIKTAKDLVPDERLRVEGRVVDGKGEPVADAEVLLVNFVDISIPFNSYEVALVEGRVRNQLGHVMTRSDDKGQFVLYPPKDMKSYVVALHPTAGFTLQRGKHLSDGGKIRLMPWATLESRFDGGAEQQQGASLGTLVREKDRFPEVNFSQYWSDLKKDPPVGMFRFTHVPPIFETTISRTFPGEQGSSFSSPGATVSLLPGESRRLDLGPMSDKQQQWLERIREMSRSRRE